MAVINYEFVEFHGIKGFVQYFHLEQEFKDNWGRLDLKKYRYIVDDPGDDMEIIRELLSKVEGLYVIVYMDRDGWNESYSIIRLLDENRKPFTNIKEAIINGKGI